MFTVLKPKVLSIQIVGVNSKKEFIYTSNCNMDLRESRNNHTNSGFTWKPNLRKFTGRGNSLFSEDYNGFYKDQFCPSS